MLLLPTLSLGIFLVTMAIANPTQVGKKLDPNACALDVCQPAQNGSLTGNGKEYSKEEKKHPGLEEATSFQDLPRSTAYIEPKGNKSSVEKEAKRSRAGLQGTKNLQNPAGKIGFPMPKEGTSSQARSGMKASASSLNGRIVGGVKVFVTSGYQGDFVSVQQMCSQAGGKLASPQDSAENSAVQQIAAMYNKEVFLGINYIQTEGKFRYWNGQAVIYSEWALGEPNNDINNKDCMEIHPNGFWNEQNCREKRLILCEF